MRANASAITSDFSWRCRSYAMCAYRDPPHAQSTSAARRSRARSRTATVSERELLLNAIDADAGALSGDRAGDEDNLSLVPRKHAPAGDGLLDG